jgi:Family of unknown function (DUF5678)
MKAKAKNPTHPVRKQPRVGRSSKAVQDKPSSPYGYRVVENEWLKAHPEELRKCAGEYVIVEGTEIIAHGKEPAKLFEVAKRRGVKTPYIFFVEPPLPPNTYRTGWL